MLVFRLDYLLIAGYSLLQVKRNFSVKTIYTLAIALMSGVILTACVGAINIGGDTNLESALINRCIIGNTAQADPTCAKAVADTNGCITDPFSSGCEVNPLFSPHVQNARDERAKFCDNTDNSKDSLCTGSDSEKDICTHNPFITLCENGYDSERKEFIERCIKGNNANDRNCKSASIALPCVANPFSDGCDKLEDFKDHHETAGANRVAFCKNSANKNNNFCLQSVHECSVNPFGAGCDTALGSYHNIALASRIDFCGIHENLDHADCAVTLSKVTTASWLQSFDDPLPTLTNGKLPNAGHAFVQGAIDGLEGESSSSKLDMSSLGGDKADGLAFTRGERNSYAGIFSGTDLGPPITEPMSSVKWDGKLNSYDNPFKSHEFMLTINFNEGRQAGTINASFTPQNRSYVITGDFDSKGIITGSIMFNTTNIRGAIETPGTLTGLIGKEGAVGVFVRNNDGTGNQNYSGGFVARPPAE